MEHMHLKVSRHLKEKVYQCGICPPWSVMQHSTRRHHTLHNIIQQLLRQFIPFLCECTDEGVLVCRRIVSTSSLPLQSIPHIFNGVLDLESTLAMRDVGNTSRCLDLPILNSECSMTCCVVVHKTTNLSPTAPRKRRTRGSRDFINVSLARHSPIRNHM
ncbi:hypothetical protein TNCV_1733971 [Trichonephila clavipes]|nr:hypothetical protein TNCV_1733971 [Trichonephila clavipes]